MREAALLPHVLQPLLETPFHNRARTLSQVDSFVAWSGYTTVDVFTSVGQEYFAIRNACSLYDLTPMVKYAVTGADAERYLNRLVTRNVAKLKPGRVAYAVLCNDAGEVIEDATIFRMGAAEFRLCMAERQLNWLLDSAFGFDVDVREMTAEIAALSVQGPTSSAVLKAAGLPGVYGLKPFEFAVFMLDNKQVTVSRTGFTGDLGYEVWMAPADASFIWDALTSAGVTRGVRAIGSLALNMARIEAGFVMPHLDFVTAESALRVGRARSPFELGLSWVIDFEKGHFNGRRALLAERAREPKRCLVGLDIEGNKPAKAALLYSKKGCRNKVGAVTSAMWSPTCKRNIALAMVDAPLFAIGSELWAEIYLCRELVWERRVARCRVVEKPFFAPERRKRTPPDDC